MPAAQPKRTVRKAAKESEFIASARRALIRAANNVRKENKRLGLPLIVEQKRR